MYLIEGFVEKIINIEAQEHFVEMRISPAIFVTCIIIKESRDWSQDKSCSDAMYELY